MDIYIAFEDSSHSYFRVQDNKKYTSVSKIISKYKEPFDPMFWSTYKTAELLLNDIDWTLATITMKKHGKDAFLDFVTKLPEFDKNTQFETQLLRDDWQEGNKESTGDGSFIHLVKEKKLEKAKALRIKDKIHRNARKKIPKTIGDYDNVCIKDLASLPDGYYTEFLIYNDKYKFAGQMDLLIIWTEKGKRYFTILDYKTNKEIKKTQYDFKGNKVTMLPPLEKYFDVNYSHYRIQLNLYAWALEQFGYTRKKLILRHLAGDEVKDTSIRKIDVVPLLNDFRQRA